MKRRDGAVCHLKALPFAIYAPGTVSPLHVEAETGAGQIARPGLPGKIESVLAVEVGTAIAGYSHSPALPDGVAEPAGPAPVLFPVENAAAIGGRRVDELDPRVELPESRIDLGAH